MAGPGELDSARRRRDLSLAFRRRLTVSAAVGATGLTVIFSLIAATTAPGRATPSATSPTQPNRTSDPASQAPAGNQPAFSVPEQPPQSGFGGSPVAISGGS